MKETRLRRPSATNCSKDAIEAARVETPPTASSSLPARRALVVGADSATLQLCRDALENSGFAVDAVDSGIAAVVAARESPPDLVLMDVQLRDVPGREAIVWLRSNPALQSTPIIVLATNAEDDVVPTFPGHMPRCRNQYRPQQSGAQFAKFSIETQTHVWTPK